MKFLFPLLILCAAAPAARAAGIDGKWISERQVGAADGKTYNHTTIITLKSDSGALTGTIVQTSEAPWMAQGNGRSSDISDGKIDGNKFSFKVKTESKQGEKTAVYEGVLEGDHLKGVIKFRGIGQTWELDAKRAN